MHRFVFTIAVSCETAVPTVLRHPRTSWATGRTLRKPVRVTAITEIGNERHREEA